MTDQFDLFVDKELPGAESRGRRGKSARPGEEEMVRLLTETGRYRILKRLEAPVVSGTPLVGFIYKGILVDTETTGLDSRKDEVIEIGIVSFTFDDLGRVGAVDGIYSGLQQPSRPIPAEITRLTGITDEEVKGRTIDIAAVEALVENADLVIAHNAGFDRPFCERLSAAFERKQWACSATEIDWKARGFEGVKLGYLVGQSGYFHNGHRAVDDCYALLKVLENTSPETKATALSELVATSRKAKIRIFAEHSPFEMKDQLKSRGYRWSDGSEGKPKCWWVEVSEEAFQTEMDYLRREVYRYPDADPPTRRIDAYQRFRN